VSKPEATPKTCKLFINQIIGINTFKNVNLCLNAYILSNKIDIAVYSVSTKKRPPPKYNGLVFEVLGKHHWNFCNRI